MTDEPASRTAVLVCQGRAVADGIPAAGSFADPIAAQLLRDDERAAVHTARAPRPPIGRRARPAMTHLSRSSHHRSSHHRMESPVPQRHR
ncbi:hypothetical protein AB0L57_04150 [Nocardia sp. NPDC052254]|uniref:hypothetical protein n=1 Tax=Nocardia sp. NPDC052254 TaxID=3155681 RepID=UPI00343959C0